MFFFLYIYIASKQVYRPPHARNSDFKPTSLHEEESSELSMILFNTIDLIKVSMYNIS